MLNVCVRAASRYLVHLVCGAVLADSDGDGGLVRQGYPQLYIRHAIVVLKRAKRGRDQSGWKGPLTSPPHVTAGASVFEEQQTQRD